MKSIAIIIWLLLGACVVASAQVEFASGDYFPADLEFRELQKMGIQRPGLADGGVGAPCRHDFYA